MAHNYDRTATTTNMPFTAVTLWQWERLQVTTTRRQTTTTWMENEDADQNDNWQQR